MDKRGPMPVVAFGNCTFSYHSYPLRIVHINISRFLQYQVSIARRQGQLHANRPSAKNDLLSAADGARGEYRG